MLLRHGQSEWNASKRFTGWVDVDLTEQGREEATHAGIMLKRHGFEFDEAHTSLLKSAVRTLWSALHCCDQHWIPVRRSWRLNERHYGRSDGHVADGHVEAGGERPGGGGRGTERDHSDAEAAALDKKPIGMVAAGPPLLDGAGSALSTFGAQRLAHGESFADVPGDGSCRIGSTTSCRRCGGGNASSSRRTIIH